MNILFADNDRDFLMTRTAYLQEAGFTVLQAYSPEEATELLRHAHIHLAIIDSRLTDDDDERDTSGLVLAESLEFRLIPKIILTGYKSVEGAQRALTPGPDGVSPAVRYVIKDDGPEKMMQEVEAALKLKVHTNENLLIHTDARAPLNLAYLSSLISWTVEPLEGSLGHDEDRLAELKDLLGRLFREFAQITLHQLLWQRDGRVALAVTAFPPTGKKQQFFVICGSHELLKQDATKYRQYAPPSVLAETASIIRREETVHLGAQAHEVIGCDLNEVGSLGDLYIEGPARRIQQFVDDLFEKKLMLWHSQPQVFGPTMTIQQILNDTCAGITAKALALLESHIAALSQEAHAEGLGAIKLAQDKLRIALPRQTTESYPNPVTCLHDEHSSVPEVAILYGSTVSALGAETIRVGNEGRMWLTDLTELGFGPLLSDYAALESEVKFGLIESVEVRERIELERALIEAARLNDRLNVGSLPPQVEKALAVIKRIRQTAASQCGNDMRPYRVCLLAHALRRLMDYKPRVRHTQREIVSLLHVCASIGLLCRCLPVQTVAISTDDAAPEPGFRLDDKDHRVFVDGSLVDVTPNEYSFLHYLWQRPGRLCDRTAIADAVYGSFVGEEGRLNMLVNRLRPKIEPNPDEPKYLITRRGEGYSLYPAGKPRD